MDFYYRNLMDGRCEVVCTRCFLTVGIAIGIEAIRELEDSHCCSKPTTAVSPRRLPAVTHHHGAPLPSRLTPVDVPGHNFSSLQTILRLIALALLLYVLPTVLEFEALRTWNPWFAIVLPGDFLGCVWLILAFRKVKTGIAVYSLLTVREGCLYSFHLVPLRALPWIADLVPILMVSGIVLRSKPVPEIQTAG